MEALKNETVSVIHKNWLLSPIEIWIESMCEALYLIILSQFVSRILVNTFDEELINRSI